MTAPEPAQWALDEATAFRDGMINVARNLADRACGATQSEMRAAQIRWVAEQLAAFREAKGEVGNA